MAKKNKNKPDLNFSPSGKPSGFTVAGVQGFSELNPAAIVRELIQNSLDAVREDGRSKAIVRFELAKLPLSDIPAIESYQAAFEKAVSDQASLQENGELTDQASTIVEAIKGCLAQGEVEVLSVLDNGIGLDERRMTALLGDGISAKSSAGAGAIGNGHLTAIPASDLRYLLYGGICKDGGKVGAGHAILASFSDSAGNQLGEDGYYTLAITQKMNAPFEFPKANAVAPLIKKKLDWIESEFSQKRGSVVVIPGFNRFNETDANLWEVIQKAAACSFFTAISDGHLRVVFVDENNEAELNQLNIGDVFEGDLVHQKRARHFLSGNRAAEAYLTAISGQAHKVDVGCGKVEVILRPINEGKSRIDLCRNGMWVAEDLPRMGIYKFGDRKPFHCLIKVTAQDGEIHRLIRKSEGPLHNDLERRKLLGAAELETLNAAFDRIANFLLENLEELQAEEATIGDFLSISSNDGIAGGGRRPGRFGNFEEVPPRSVRSPSVKRSGSGGGGGGGGNGGGGQSTSAFKKSGNPVPFSAIPVPTGARSYDVELKAEEALSDNMVAEIRFILDESIDETCDLSNEEQFVRLKNVKLNKKKLSTDDLIKSDKDVLGVRLGSFDTEQSLKLSFDYELPQDINLNKNDKVVLRAEIVKRRIESEAGNA